MARYYFDLMDDTGCAIDDEGTELDNLLDVQEEAARSLADLVRDAFAPFEGTASRELAIVVRDNIGPVLRAQFTLTLEPGRKQ